MVTEWQMQVFLVWIPHVWATLTCAAEDGGLPRALENIRTQGLIT